MKFVSTRGLAPVLDFDEVVLTGLASDGGLYVPEKLPVVSEATFRAWQVLPYDKLAIEVMWPFVEGTILRETFELMVIDAYASFRHEAIAPIKQLTSDTWLLELFHGPTLAFKDFALQLLGRLLDHFLARRGEHGVVMGATSGDTGSAAIEGSRHSKHLDLIILHPYQRVSEVQRRQMTTVMSANVHNIALKGNFDDCQAIVKASFMDQDFVQPNRLLAVNSINLARIMAQTVYYIYSGLRIGVLDRPVLFSVPSANFGDAYGGYMACQMGLPIAHFTVATNANDALVRALSGDLSRKPLTKTLSPSMDIVVSSNFERLLFDLYGKDGEQIANVMKAFQTGSVTLDSSAVEKARGLFSAIAVDDDRTCDTIRRIFAETGELIDPHTATGMDALSIAPAEMTKVVLATAHPAKFSEAVQKAGFDEVPLPSDMSDLLTRDERYTILENDLSEVQHFVHTVTK
ncbi:threonine synthase [Litorivicinus sp.]|jgi:threonine synthase|nr:threonine synthase [Litorivicinus sp.]MDB9863319.1 threonine synthase [Litorivicinus sp.]MDC1208421.1 threonine synthase [Litorivicinus sp.]MDC1240848.1 threonine synthase [Litorivicinus sp.]|tara:strand:+ start:11101 stop:12480 length:1380 start_codon:yes stop_codon:yes gene_type:complete